MSKNPPPSRPTKPSSTGSSQPDTKKESQVNKEDKEKGRWDSFKDSVVQFDKDAKELKEKAEKSKVAKVAAKGAGLASGKLGTRIGVIVATSAALAAAAGPAAIAPLAIGLIGVGVAVIADTLQVRNTRLLKKENDMLARFVDSKLTQEQLLKKNPELATILESKLVDKAKVKVVQEGDIHKDTTKATRYAEKLSDNFGTIDKITKKLVKLDFIGAGVELIKGGYAAITGKERRDFSDDVRKTLEKQIDILRDSKFTPNYSSKFELKSALREQRIQQMALGKLSEEVDELKKIYGVDDLKNIGPLKDEELKEIYKDHKPEEDRKAICIASTVDDLVKTRFGQIKAEIESKEKAVSERTWTQEVKSFFKDMRRAHDPQSQYYKQSTVNFNAVTQEKHFFDKSQHTHKLVKFKGKDFGEYQTKTSIIESERTKLEQQAKEQKIDVKFAGDDRQNTIAKLPKNEQKQVNQAAKKIKGNAEPAKASENSSKTPTSTPSAKKSEARGVGK